MAMAAARLDRDLIDFSYERGRHGELLGREALLTELTTACQSLTPSGGWVLVQGGPGLGNRPRSSWDRVSPFRAVSS